MWTKLHDLAALRGDGLRAEILELLASRQAIGNVEDISAYLVDHFSQAGPVPVATVGSELPEGVLPFRRPEQPTENDVRRPRRKI